MWVDEAGDGPSHIGSDSKLGILSLHIRIAGLQRSYCTRSGTCENRNGLDVSS